MHTGMKNDHPLIPYQLPYHSFADDTWPACLGAIGSFRSGFSGFGLDDFERLTSSLTSESPASVLNSSVRERSNRLSTPLAARSPSCDVARDTTWERRDAEHLATCISHQRSPPSIFPTSWTDAHSVQQTISDTQLATV